MLPDIDPKENLPDEYAWQHPIIAILAGLVVITLCLAVAMALMNARSG